MKTKTITLYEYSELSQKAKNKALAKWCENNDMPFLADNLAERLHELLEENGIKDTNDTSKAGTKPTPVLYSLSSCQGDGAMFEGTFTWGKYTVYIKHSGRYYHSNSKTIEIVDENGHEASEENHNESLNDDFEEVYQAICKELERMGYDEIEHENSEENFIEMCEANEWTFREDGTMENL